MKCGDVGNQEWQKGKTDVTLDFVAEAKRRLAEGTVPSQGISKLQSLIEQIKTTNLNFFTLTVSDFLSSQHIVKTITVTVWVYIQNLGDGSARAKFFNSEEAAEKYAAHDDERYCDDIYGKTLEFDMDGMLVTPNPIHYSEEFKLDL